jgi:pyridoxal phosphate enzyme (YggS family)
MTSFSFIQENYCKVLERIDQAARRSGRDPAEVKLVVVTKTHTLETVQAVVNAGAACLGENYAEEAISKIEGLHASRQIEWHMIGHVQSKKAEAVCNYFDYIQSVDSTKLAGRLDRFAREKERRIPILLECNLGGEATKFGWPVWDDSQWELMLSDIWQILECNYLDVRGLMGMAPYFSEPEQARQYFRKLRHFQQYLIRVIPKLDWRELSMGMSGDFEVAIEEGATWVRIGTSILGPRN